VRSDIRNKLTKIAGTALLVVAAGTGCSGQGTDQPGGPDGVSPNVASSTTFCDNEPGASTGVTIAWDVTYQYSDNSPLDFSEIQGYKVYFGTQTKQYNNVIFVDDPAMTSCAIPVSSSDSTSTYYVAMTVVTKDGLESDYSNEIVRSI
jgi:hypothetical protein